LSEKRGIFSFMETICVLSPNTAGTPKHAGGKASVSIDAAIRARLSGANQRSVFSPADFSGLGSRAAVDKVLSRLTASGELRRIGRGLYDRPLAAASLPSVEEIARALAGSGNVRMQPYGAYAVTLLGLASQVPLKVTFLTDGVTRSVWIGSRQIVLRPSTPRNLATAGRISGLVIQALRHLGQAEIDEQVLQQLRRRLTSDDMAILMEDISFAPAWIARMMRSIAQGTVHAVQRPVSPGAETGAIEKRDAGDGTLENQRQGK
jgi:hypothetical protein